MSDEKGFGIIWCCFSWSNQTLAMIALWAATAYPVKKGKYRFGSLLTAIPAAFMSAVCMTYILTAGEGFGISAKIAVPVGVGFAAALLIVYIILWTRSQKHGRERLS